MGLEENVGEYLNYLLNQNNETINFENIIKLNFDKVQKIFMKNMIFLI